MDNSLLQETIGRTSTIQKNNSNETRINAHQLSKDEESKSDKILSTGEPNGENLSKRKRKRLLREQQWLEQKQDRKRREKERRKARRIVRQLEINSKKQNETKNPKRLGEIVKMSSSSCKVSIVIDCDYEQYMNEHELRKLCKQLNRCYALNRHSERPVQLWLTSIKGKILELLQRLQPGHDRWDCHVTSKHWSSIFKVNNDDQRTNEREDCMNVPKAKLIYLTGDSRSTIPDCQQIQQSNDYVFIIGGLIDHNHHKGLCLKRAIEEFDCQHGQLPISYYCRLNQSSILSIPHVFQIMLFAANNSHGQNWAQIFKKVIPNRKLINK